MKCMVKLVKRQAGVDILAQQPYHLGLECAPGGTEVCQALNSLRTALRLKNGVCIGRKLLAAQSPSLFVAKRLSADRIDPRQVAVAEGLLKSADFVDHAALLFSSRE